MPKPHPYDPFLHRVLKPAQYLGGEQGQITKAWSEVECKICLAFPDLYEVGMSHLGYKILYSIINQHPKLLAERAYAVWGDMESELRQRKERLRALESARPLCDFDIVGFSLQYELTYTNILQMLELGGIPLWSHQRDTEQPLIVAGGPTATHAEAIAPFIDVFLIGDGEEKTPELMLSWSALRKAGVPRQKALEHIAQLGGFYVPSLYETHRDEQTGLEVVDPPQRHTAPYPIKRAIVSNLKEHPFPADGPTATTQTVFDRVSIEIARGCTEGCRFCQAGMIYRPVRERDPQHIIDTIARAVREGGYDEASLTSLSTADYSAIAPLVRSAISQLKGQNVSLSVSSLRAYGLSETVLDDMKQQRAGGLTFAPEAGTQRMRDVINKNVTEAQLMETAERIFSRGWSKMKLYFMIGLPTEELEDVVGIIETGARALAVARRAHPKRRGRVTVSVSTHVPKPHTPFQWCAMDSLEDIVAKQSILHSEAKRSRVQLRVHGLGGSWLEGILARGDRSLAPAIARAFERGARFDSWDEVFKQEIWKEALEHYGIDPQKHLNTLPLQARLPWDHIDVGLEEGFLTREYRKALANRLSPPCGKAAGMFVHHTNTADTLEDKRRLVCYDCGIACDMAKMKNDRLIALKNIPAYTSNPLSSVKPGADRRPMRNVDQGNPLRIRFAFKKIGRAAFMSHLDLVRIFPRFFRRIGLKPYLSEGFRPKPLMTFSPALGLGIFSVAEYVDVKFCDSERLTTVGTDLIAELNAASIDGLEFFDTARLEPQDQKITKVIDRAAYVAAISQRELEELDLSLEEFKALIEHRSSLPELIYTRSSPKGGKELNLANVLLHARVGTHSPVIAEAGLLGQLIPLQFSLHIGQQGGARPAEVLEVLSEGRLKHATFIRTGVFDGRSGMKICPMQACRQRESLTAALQVAE